MNIITKFWYWLTGTECYVKPKKRLTAKITHFESGPTSTTTRTVTHIKRGSWIRTDSGRKVFPLRCWKCKRRSNTTNINTAKRSRYLCRNCYQKIKARQELRRRIPSTKYIIKKQKEINAKENISMVRTFTKSKQQRRRIR